MTKEQLIQGVLAGKPLLVVEYRSFVADVKTKADKSNPGKRVAMPLIEHSLELGDQQCKITVFPDTEAECRAATAPFKKGDKCVLEALGFGFDNGALRARGTLHPLTEK